MKILVVSAHDDPRSYLAALHNTALGVLERAGHQLLITDLYAQGFNPVATKQDFVVTSGAAQSNYMFEQQRSVNTGSGFSADIQAEIDKLTSADMLILHFPLWWGSVPAIMKGWLDRVLAMGITWDADSKFASGKMRGKKALVVTTVGDPDSYYATDGMHQASVQQHLYPLLHNTLAFCGFDVLQPVVFANVTAASKDQLEANVTRYRDYLAGVEQSTRYIYRHQ